MESVDDSSPETLFVGQTTHENMTVDPASSTSHSRRASSSSALEEFVARTVQSVNGGVSALANIGVPYGGQFGGQQTPVTGLDQLASSLLGRSPQLATNNGNGLLSHHSTPEKLGASPALFASPMLNTFNDIKQLDTTTIVSALQALLAEQQRVQPCVPGLPDLVHETNSLNGGAWPRRNTAGTNDFRGEIKKLMETRPSLFWPRMKEMGLLDDMLATLCSTVDQLRQLYQRGGAEEFGMILPLRLHLAELRSTTLAAQKLSQLSSVLDLDFLYADKIHSRYVQTTLESGLFSTEIQGMAWSGFEFVTRCQNLPYSELQKKADERVIKLERTKRKSQALDEIIRRSMPLHRLQHGPNSPKFD